MSDSLLNIAVVGASGYVGAELVDLLTAHPQVGQMTFISRSLSGTAVAAHIPAVRGRGGHATAVFHHPEKATLAQCDAVFFATPHAVAMNEAAQLLAQGAVVIDLSPDFRLSDVTVFTHWYGSHSAAHLLPQAVYGLTEAARPQISTASLIACPGCFATAVELALIPLAAAKVIAGQVIIDAKSGVSGAGRRSDRPDLLFTEQAENFKAYAITGHRHQPEIEQALAQFTGASPSLIFVPHLLPTTRGIYATLYVPIKNGTDAAAILQAHWRNEPFIDVLTEEIPALTQVTRTNRAQLAAQQVNDHTAVVIAALDNLQKGAAGQAIQNMNVRFGLPETTGLAGART